MSSEISKQESAEKAAPAFRNKNVKKPLSGQKEITKIVAVSSDKVLPADAAQAAYASGYPVTLKETCYGLVLTGTEENVNAVVKIVQDLDKNHIFVKDRGFPAGDPRRCRATRNGGQRPGFYTLHEEISKMGTVGDALDNYEAGVEKTEAEWPNRPSSFKIEDYITDEIGKSKKKPEMAKVVVDRIAAKKEAAQMKADAENASAKKTVSETETKKKAAKAATKTTTKPAVKTTTKPAVKTTTKPAVKTTAKPAAKATTKSAAKATAKKTTAKKPAAKTATTKTASEKAASTKTTAAKTASEKAASTKTTAAKTAAAKTAAAKTSAKKTSAEKQTAEKKTTQKTTAKTTNTTNTTKTTAEKTTAKKK
ncbi:hypothetical protein MmiHf6_15350 [Methanimicrococcus hongohii]|uniref:Uncharacterized protein n=1 Tax=Methanimicrococcus hongohii TaxID=3028295 RepID=A0AA96V1M7_9EURY|nr:methanogenesis marker 6 protein [Methanimicrococcus sp. Hf6]WNY24205.1 hypothetical protein MmiHf6_15350 [Methanimicrococcus sp. Hf6]